MGRASAPAASVKNSNFVVEPTHENARLSETQDSLLQDVEKRLLWYQDYFLGKAHYNLLALDSPLGPLAVSIEPGHVDEKYRIMVRSSQCTQRFYLRQDMVSNPWYRRLLGLRPSLSSIMDAISVDIPVGSLILCKNPALPQALVAVEERQIIRSYKFGVGYLAPGQSTAFEMFSNKEEELSDGFMEFLSFLGDVIDLEGWEGYRAGLDVTANLTGTRSVYTKWQGYEIMFHVAPFLPLQAYDHQRVERKRHLGNDIVLILYSESDKPFDISTLNSKQNHVVCIIQPEGQQYRMSVYFRDAIPSFAPKLPEPTVLDKDVVSRDFLLQKLVMGERAAYKVPIFANKISRTRGALLHELGQRFLS
jgi:RAP1 GTPase activating protein 1